MKKNYKDEKKQTETKIIRYRFSSLESNGLVWIAYKFSNLQKILFGKNL